jgi:uncharacterized protein (TIGR00369 family)
VSSAIPEETHRIFTSAPFAAELGLRLESVGPGTCTSSLPLERRHLQQDGFVHAGVQAAMADHTAGGAAASLLRKGQYVLSAEFKINLLRAAKGERLVCRARVLKAGAQLTVAESEVYCEASGTERLVSKMTVTLAVISRRATSRRPDLSRRPEAAPSPPRGLRGA